MFLLVYVYFFEDKLCVLSFITDLPNQSKYRPTCISFTGSIKDVNAADKINNLGIGSNPLLTYDR